jgi:hypothetical protein
MQAIETKYIPATNSKGTRLKAFCCRGSITVTVESLSGSLTEDERHAYVARLLAHKFAVQDLKEYGSPIESNPWMRPFVSGGLKSGQTVHVTVEPTDKTIFLSFNDPEDADRVRRYTDMAKKQDGTVGGVWAGLMCSALNRCTIN